MKRKNTMLCNHNENKLYQGKFFGVFFLCSFAKISKPSGDAGFRATEPQNVPLQVPLQIELFLCTMINPQQPAQPESEERIQSQAFQWAWNAYPSTRGLLCYNLNNSRNRIDGARNRALGLQPGRADMVLYWRATATFFEFKTPTGTQQPVQLDWQGKVQAQGFRYHIVRSVQDFQTLFNSIMRYG